MSNSESFGFSKQLFGVSQKTLLENPENAIKIIRFFATDNMNTMSFIEYFHACCKKLEEPMDKVYEDLKTYDSCLKEATAHIPVVNSIDEITDADIEKSIKALTIEQFRTILRHLANFENLTNHVGQFLNGVGDNFNRLQKVSNALRNEIREECPEIAAINTH